jgi:RNA polymerase-binding transcription factor
VSGAPRCLCERRLGSGLADARRLSNAREVRYEQVAPDDLDLAAVRAELEARRDRDRERLGVLAQRPERGSAVGFGKRIGDGTSEAVSRLTDIGVGESLERGLDRIERALLKIDEGTYGICDACGRPISRGRLTAMPDGVLCLDCSASERRVRPARRR